MMMFQVTIQTPDGEQSVDLTNKDCVRFGKATDFVIPVAEDHCATVYRRNGQFHFSNRSTQDYRVGHAGVKPDESVVWKTGKRIELDSGVSMQLSVVSESKRKIAQNLNLEKIKQITAFNQDEKQLVDDKVVALLCGALLFYALLLL